MEFYVVVHHGTAGMSFSFGYAAVEVIHSLGWLNSKPYLPPVSDMTTTVSGPYSTRDEAESVAEEINTEFDKYAETH